MKNINENSCGFHKIHGVKIYKNINTCNNCGCEEAQTSFNSCSSNKSQQVKAEPTAIQAQKVNTNRGTAYAVQAQRLYDSLIFKQTSNCPLNIADASWQIEAVCGNLPATDRDYILKIEEICIGEYTLEIQNENLSLDTRELDSPSYIYDGNLSTLRNYSIDNEGRFCCNEQQGQGTTPVFARTGLSYQFEDDPIEIRLKASCGCAKFNLVTTVSGMQFNFFDVESQVYIPSGVRANYLQNLRNLKLGFSFIKGATIRAEKAYQYPVVDADMCQKPMPPMPPHHCTMNYTVHIPQIKMLLYLEETVNSVSLENMSFVGANDQIEPREVPTGQSICNFIGCSEVE